MSLEQERRRLAWQCRRGMLELDLLLEAFLQQDYARLPPHEREAFAALVHESDPDLFQWLFERPDTAPESYHAVIRRLRRTRTR